MPELVFIRPDRSPPVHYAETSMKNGFGLKYIHKFLNLPFLLLQVSYCSLILQVFQKNALVSNSINPRRAAVNSSVIHTWRSKILVTTNNYPTLLAPLLNCFVCIVRFCNEITFNTSACSRHSRYGDGAGKTVRVWERRLRHTPLSERLE